MPVSNSKPSSCKSDTSKTSTPKPGSCQSDTSKTSTSKTDASIAKVHMSVSNSNTSKPTSCKADTSQPSPSKAKTDTSNSSSCKSGTSKPSTSKTDTFKPGSCQSDTSKPSTTKTNASIAKVHMPTSANQTQAWTCNKPTLDRCIEQSGTTEGEKLSITVSFWPLIFRNFLFSVDIKFAFDASLQGDILGMSVLVIVVILGQHLCVHPVEVSNNHKGQQSETQLDLHFRLPEAYSPC